MYHVMLTLFIINVCYLTYFFYITIKLAIKATKKLPEMKLTKLEELFDSMKTKVGKIAFYAASVLMILVLVVISFYMIWVPILVWNTSGLFWGVLSLFIVMISDSIFSSRILKKAREDVRRRELILLSEVMRYSSILLGVLLFTDLKIESLQELLINVYQADIFMKTTLIVFIPSVFIALIATNSFAIVKRTKFLLTKNLDKYRVTSKRMILLSIVSFSFIGIFYLNQLDLSFVSSTDKDVIKGAMELFGLALTAFFIPLFLDDLTKRSNVNG